MRRDTAVPALPSFKNTHTFLYLDPIEEIPRKRIIVLDEYAFDTEELAHRAQNTILEFYQNPHTKKEFSEEAKKALQEEPSLRIYVAEFQRAETEMHWLQHYGLRPAAVTAVGTSLTSMLTTIDRDGDNAAQDAVVRFFAGLYQQLNQTERHRLLQSIVRVNTPYGGSQNIRFTDILGSSCTHRLQIFAWQMVLTLMPTQYSQIPRNVFRLAQASDLILSPTPQVNSAPRVNPLEPHSGEHLWLELRDENEANARTNPWRIARATGLDALVVLSFIIPESPGGAVVSVVANFLRIFLQEEDPVRDGGIHLFNNLREAPLINTLRFPRIRILRDARLWAPLPEQGAAPIPPITFGELGDELANVSDRFSRLAGPVVTFFYLLAELGEMAEGSSLSLLHFHVIAILLFLLSQFDRINPTHENGHGM